MTSFVNIYENALSEEFCNSCIKKFNRSRYKVAGKTGQGVDLVKKNSTDITINNHLDEWKNELNTIQNVVLNGLIHYCRQFPFILSGAIAIQKMGKQGTPVDITYQDIPKMDDQALANIIMSVYRLGTTNIQKYDKGKGGYFHWHSENFPHPSKPENDSLHRVLLWMFYLNDVEDGGETEFFHQNLKLKPKRGTLIIAPSDFTHTHRGSMPISNDKYIFTSWMMFQPAAKLYGINKN